jgi:dihydroorotase
MSIKPREILRLEPVCLEVGSLADITVVDPQLSWRVRAQDMYSKSQNSPFIGWELTGAATDVLCKGKLTLENRQVLN